MLVLAVPDTLQGVPEVISTAHSLVQKLIKVLVVAKDHMTAHVKQKALWCDICACQAASFGCLHSHSHL